jgi:hypothetical protein
MIKCTTEDIARLSLVYTQSASKRCLDTFTICKHTLGITRLSELVVEIPFLTEIVIVPLLASSMIQRGPQYEVKPLFLPYM